MEVLGRDLIPQGIKDHAAESEIVAHIRPELTGPLPTAFIVVRVSLLFYPQEWMDPPQYSQQPLASGVVVAPHQGQVIACLGAAAALASSRTC